MVPLGKLTILGAEVGVAAAAAGAGLPAVCCSKARRDKMRKRDFMVANSKCCCNENF